MNDPLITQFKWYLKAQGYSESHITLLCSYAKMVLKGKKPHGKYGQKNYRRAKRKLEEFIKCNNIT